MEQQVATQLFIGNRLANCAQMTRLEYNELRGWTLPDNENGGDQGYMVGDIDGKPNIEQFDEYISWLPSAEFERMFRKTDHMTFDDALIMLKLGKKVARKGWNGKGMWLILVPGSENIKPVAGTPYSNAGLTQEIQILPHIDMYTTDSTGRKAMLPGWLASQSDMLSCDWTLVA